MNFDISAVKANLDTWDLTLTVDNEPHPVREVTLQEFSELVRREAMTADEQIATLAGMFQKTAPAVANWPADTRDLVYNAIGAYLNEHLEKKRLRVRTMMKAAINAGGRPAGPVAST